MTNGISAPAWPFLLRISSLFSHYGVVIRHFFMKNFQVNLLIVLALGLCGLCAWQWYEQTIQRDEIQTLNRMVYDRDTSIQNYTNSIATLNHQVNQMDASLTETKAAAATNEQLVISQKAKIVQLRFANDNFTNEIAQYKTGVDALEAKLKEA